MFCVFKVSNPSIQLSCPSQHIICVECCDRVFEATHISQENKSIGKCFCRGDLVIEECFTSKSFERIISNLTIKCSNYINGCNWKCDLNRIDHQRLKNEHLKEECRYSSMRNSNFNICLLPLRVCVCN